VQRNAGRKQSVLWQDRCMARQVFQRHSFPTGTSLSALLQPSGRLCGVYILEFDDGTEYVGQSIDFLSRFSSHQRHQPGTIIAFSFAELPRTELDQIERSTIQQRVDSDKRLRNHDLVGFPLSGPALDVVIEPAVQEEWLDSPNPRLVLGDRLNRPRANASMRQKYQQFKNLDVHKIVIQMLAEYIAVAVPWPHKTESRFWSVTAVPSTNRSPSHRRLAAITINNVEVLVIFHTREDKAQPWDLGWFVNVASDQPLPRSASQNSELTTFYAKAGEVRRVLAFDPFDYHPQVAVAARKLALGLLRKGQGMMARYHNPLLADAVFKELKQIEAWQEQHF